MTDFTSDRVTVDDVPIYYEKRGTGDHVVLLLPGAMGTTTTDFLVQYKSLDLTKFTLICWDAPGYGKSRPPPRNASGNYYRRDAAAALALMKQLGYTKFSCVGFSDGGRTALIMAATDPSVIRKVVAWGCNSYITQAEKDSFVNIRDIGAWEESIRKPLQLIYGHEMQPLWSKLCDAWMAMDNIFKEDLPKIECPVFILHGEKDPMVARHHADYFRTQIAKCRIHRFPRGGHNIHQTVSNHSHVVDHMHDKYLQQESEFNNLVSEFLLA